jgi:hypothetical protein
MLFIYSVAAWIGSRSNWCDAFNFSKSSLTRTHSGGHHPDCLVVCFVSSILSLSFIQTDYYSGTSFDPSSTSGKQKYALLSVVIVLPTLRQAVTTLQAAASLACDLLITIYLCLFLESQKGEMMK